LRKAHNPNSTDSSAPRFDATRLRRWQKKHPAHPKMGAGFASLLGNAAAAIHDVSTCFRNKPNYSSGIEIVQATLQPSEH